MPTTSNSGFRHPQVDLEALARELGADLGEGLSALADLYAAIDKRLAATTAGLDLPCGRGCSSCCHESVFVTPLEFFAVWDFVQKNLSPAARDQIIDQARAIYERNRELFAALGEPLAPEQQDHLRIAKELRFVCPMLAEDGACLVYPVRELYARLFGSSFNDDGGVYGCHLVGAHLAGREVTLVKVRGAARELARLPLTFMRRPYPYYVELLYG